MNTLSVSQIFSNLPYYQDQYLGILQNPELYFTPVEDAYLNIRFLKNKQLYLGDLLQLWFSEKWVFNPNNKLSFTQFFSKLIPPTDANLYLISIEGNAVSGRNKCKAWCLTEQKVIETHLDAVLPYYCYFESIPRPLISFLSSQKEKLPV
ncbi:hypothetical protein [Acinetobacter equi]|uniref:Uncharacterized protein n=1 Tax=Acinetobacter equi TaxID=1324350 RepID=A0A0N9VGE3_9GAMM|nr:hypothetical protein [Acinetobacter equi]ALH96494.1 hypothetical protein AOY20_13600 [Acinetobacter equi]